MLLLSNISVSTYYKYPNKNIKWILRCIALNQSERGLSKLSSNKPNAITILIKTGLNHYFNLDLPLKTKSNL